MKNLKDAKNTFCPGDEIELRENPDAFGDWQAWSYEGLFLNWHT